MVKPRTIRTAASLVLCLFAVTLVTACGGGAGGTESYDQALSDVPDNTTDNTPPKFDPTDPNEFVPSPGNGLEIVEDDPNASSSVEFIESQWVYMQTCLQVSALEPVVTVVDGKIVPIGSNDDVVRHIDGRIVASAHVTDVDASIQVLKADFDGSLGKPGSYLRSITGRYLWLANGLSERDYPHECAQGE